MRMLVGLKSAKKPKERLLPRQRWLLQAHLLRHRLAPVHGTYPECLLREQMRFLLAKPHQSSGDGLEV